MTDRAAHVGLDLADREGAVADVADLAGEELAAERLPADTERGRSTL